MMLRIDREMALISLTARAGRRRDGASTSAQRIHVQYKAVQDYFGDISARVQENLAGVRVVRAFGRSANEIETFSGMNREYVERNRIADPADGDCSIPACTRMIGVMFGIVFFLGSRQMLARHADHRQLRRLPVLPRPHDLAADRARLGDQSLPARHGVDGAAARGLVGRAGRARPTPASRSMRRRAATSTSAI